MSIAEQENYVMPDGTEGIGDGRRIAAQLQQDNPHWVIMYGSYSHEFVAFPMYPDAPAYSYLAASNPGKLSERMRKAEEGDRPLRDTTAARTSVAN